MHFAVACCMRNEAMFILEWVAHQRLCGFRTVIVATNDCTDGTDLICDDLAAADPEFIHIRNDVLPGEAAQIKGMARVFELPTLRDIDYLLHCDADEFLQIDVGAGHVSDLIDVTGPHDCIALVWRPFGDAGHKKWTGGLVTEKCNRTAAFLRTGFAMHKSLFKPTQFGRATDHMPKDPKSKAVSVVNTRGEAMPAASLFHPRHARYRGTPPEMFTWDNASISHYAIRSEDVFLMKNQRGDGMARTSDRHKLNSKFWRQNNKNKVVMPVDAARLAAMKKIIADLRGIGDIAALEADALIQFEKNRNAYLTPQMIDALTLKS